MGWGMATALGVFPDDFVHLMNAIYVISLFSENKPSPIGNVGESVDYGEEIEPQADGPERNF